MTWLAVTPARNEKERLPSLAASLKRQKPGLIGLWVIVDDGSTDGTGDSSWEGMPFPVEVLRRESAGGLAAGSAFAAFLEGAEHGLSQLPAASRVLKLDADIVLAHDYLEKLAVAAEMTGLIGGVLVDAGEQARADHVRGALKAYNRDAFDIVRQLPAAVGFDVLDEVALRMAGLEVRVIDEAQARTTRRTGSSEGDLAGCRRQGRVAQWTGYHPFYMLLRVVRHLWRPPYIRGSVVMAHAWLRSGPGPFPRELRHAHRREQSERLRNLVRSPIRTLQQDYRMSPRLGMRKHGGPPGSGPRRSPLR